MAVLEGLTIDMGEKHKSIGHVHVTEGALCSGGDRIPEEGCPQGPKFLWASGAEGA